MQRCPRGPLPRRRVGRARQGWGGTELCTVCSHVGCRLRPSSFPAALGFLTSGVTAFLGVSSCFLKLPPRIRVYLFDFRERRGEKYIDVRGTAVSCLLYVPPAPSNPQPFGGRTGC